LAFATQVDEQINRGLVNRASEQHSRPVIEDERCSKGSVVFSNLAHVLKYGERGDALANPRGRQCAQAFEACAVRCFVLHDE